MMMFLILNSAQALLVRGPSQTNPAAALAPIPRAGDGYILNVSVLRDPAHEAHWTLLGSLQTMDNNDPAFPAPLMIEE